MLQKVVLFILSLLILVLFVVGQTQKSRALYQPSFMPIELNPIPDGDPMKITYFSRRRLEVQNVSNKTIRSFAIKIFAPTDDRTPLEVIRVGNSRRFENLVMLKPNESLSIPITPQIFETFIKHSKPLLHIQLAEFSYKDEDWAFEGGGKYETGYRVMVEMK